MKVLKLRKLEGSEKNLYKFNLVLEGFIVNGFLYNRDTGSILMPTYLTRGGKRRSLVRSFGIHVVRLRKLLDEALNVSANV